MPPLFDLGDIAITTPAQDVLAQWLPNIPIEVAVLPFLTRHMHGDWGSISPDDAASNQEALTDGSRIMSVYELGERLGEKSVIWVITDATDADGCRRVTTILLPDDY